MSKKKIVKNKDGFIIDSSMNLRRKIKFYYVEKFYNIFMNKFDFKDTISYQQKEFLLKYLWSGVQGRICAFKPEINGKVIQDENDKYFNIVFAPYVVGGSFNCYDYPITVRAVNIRNVSFIPSRELEVDKDVVIGFIQRNKKGVYSSLDPIIEKIVEFEMTIRTNLKAQKTPWIIGVTPENETKMKNLWENIDSDNPNLFVSIEDIKNAKALVSGASYYIDKLEQQRQQAVDEAMAMLGAGGVGIMEKKEHLTVGEVNVNNDVISLFNDIFIDNLKEFFDRINKVFNTSLLVDLKESYNEDVEETPEEDDENE